MHGIDPQFLDTFNEGIKASAISLKVHSSTNYSPRRFCRGQSPVTYLLRVTSFEPQSDPARELNKYDWFYSTGENEGSQRIDHTRRVKQSERGRARPPTRRQKSIVVRCIMCRPRTEKSRRLNRRSRPRGRCLLNTCADCGSPRVLWLCVFTLFFFTVAHSAAKLCVGEKPNFEP